MKCPLFRSANISSDFDSNWSGDDCLKEECAGWDNKFQQCVDITKARQLLRIANSLNAILDKMPHTGQFTK